MNAYLRQNVLDPVRKLPISDEQFEAIAKSRITLASAFALEESYDLLIGNYVEVEQEILSATASYAVRDLTEHQDFFELRATINRRVVNLLTAARLYLDQARQRFSGCSDDPEKARADFEQRANHHYDSCFGYRFLEALRNHVQHCGLAVHRLSLDTKWIKGGGEKRMCELSIHPFVEQSQLAADGKFKQAVLNEMQPKEVLIQHIREYLERIGDLHRLARERIAGHADAARQTIQKHISMYAEQSNDSPIGLTAFRTNAEGQEERVPLFLDGDDVRLKLISRNSSMMELGRIFVTGRIK